MSAVVKIVVGIALVVAAVVLAPFTGGLSLYLIPVGLSLVVGGVTQLLTQKKNTTKQEASKVNVRLSEPIRWINAGTCRQGGGVLFADFDSDGNFWYLVVHCDSILKNTVKRYFDDMEITLDGSGNVITNDFCLNDKKEPYEGSGTRVPYFQMWTTTYTESNPTPPAIASLAAAFPTKWDADHKLVGTTYSVVKCKTLKLEDRSKIYKWRGPIGIGEPSVSIVGEWSNVYDPRDDAQTLGDRTTYAFSRNAVLIWAWFRTHPFGRNKAVTSINWDKVGEQATICDQSIVGIESTQPRYTCDAAIPDDQERATVEQSILMAMDAQLVFDDDGKCWPRVGYYQAPTLALSRNRDIVAMESIETGNQETEIQGVVVRYTDPSANYTVQPCAPWYHPDYYVPGHAANFTTVDILTISNHNQAMRIAKTIGMRSFPPHSLAPTVGLRGLQARQERILNLNYDNTFAGDYEIISPVEVDPVGIFCGFGIVPVDANRWTLLTGEEKTKAGLDGGFVSNIPALPTGVTIAYTNGRIEATFDPPPREDITYEFQYLETANVGTGFWLNMTTDMLNHFAYSGTLPAGLDFSVRWRAISASGRVSDWSDDPADLGQSENVGSSLQQAILNSWIVEVAAGIVVVSIASDGTLTITDHTRRYPDGHADVSVTGATISTGLASGDIRSIAYDDGARLGGAVTYLLFENDNNAHAADGQPNRHYVGYFAIPSTGSAGGGGGGVSGGSLHCVTEDTPILLANGDHDGPGMEKVAADIQAGDWVWTQHEDTLKFGAFEVEAVRFAVEPVYRAAGLPRATASHRFWRDGAWTTMASLGVADGAATVAKITVRDAHTYISAGILSHNVKIGELP
jgi:hypothetical protein